MGLSSGCLAMVWVEGGALLEHAPEDGCLASGESDEGLGMTFALRGPSAQTKAVRDAV